MANAPTNLSGRFFIITYCTKNVSELVGPYNNIPIKGLKKHFRASAI